MWDVPRDWTLKDAATVPVAYMTAYYALLIRGGLQPHHRVLVHSGTGAVGMAAIRICRHRGCEVRASRCNIPLSDPLRHGRCRHGRHPHLPPPRLRGEPGAAASQPKQAACRQPRIAKTYQRLARHQGGRLSA